MTPYSCGQPRRNSQTVNSFPFYVASIKGLSSTQKFILILLADAHNRGSPFQPSLMALGKLCSCSRRTAIYAIRGLAGQHGWIVNDWRGGQKTNVYLPGWRMKRILGRTQKAPSNKGGR